MMIMTGSRKLSFIFLLYFSPPSLLIAYLQNLLFFDVIAYLKVNSIQIVIFAMFS